MSIQSALLAEIESYITMRKMSESSFGVAAVNDWKLVSRLRSGANMTLATLNKVRAYLDANAAAPVNEAAE
jgi:hypothetical protein